MKNRRQIVALIPARKGSKRVQGKNIRLLGEKPLIQWTISAALECSSIDRVIVTTDCEEIARISKQGGAEVPFLRPSELSSDTASTDDVILHAIDELSLQDEDSILLLQPTSPFRSIEDLEESIAQIDNSSDVHGVVSVSQCEHSPLWASPLSEDLSMEGFISDELSQTRSQDLPSYYRLNGSIFAYNVGFFRKEGKRSYIKGIKAIITSTRDSIDIDTEDDFLFAQYLIK